MVCVALLLAGCGPAAGTLAPRKSSGDTAELLEMLAPGQEVYRFTANTGEAYSELHVWAEVYEDGELTYDGREEAFIAFNFDEERQPKPFKGDILLSLMGEKRDSLYIACMDEQGLTSLIDPQLLPVIDNDFRSHSGLQDTLAIRPGEEMVLYVDLYGTEDGHLPGYTTQEFARTDPPVEEFGAVRLIKCRFELEES